MNDNIRRLLQKYVLDECSPEELQELLIYFQSLKSSKEMPSVESVLEMLKEYPAMNLDTADRIFNNILDVSSTEQKKVMKKKRPNTHVLKYVSFAAIFLITFGIFLYWNTLSDTNMSIPPNAITLELENGSIKIIEEDGSGVITDSDGNIIGNQDKNQLAYNSTHKTKKLVYNTLSVPYGKRIEVILSDGTKAHLNAGSSLKYPVSFIEKERQVFLTGEVFLDVAKNEQNPFIVNAGNLNIRVLGTQFNVSAYPEDEIAEVVLVEGSVGMYEKTKTFDEKKSTVLVPGDKGSFDKVSNGIETKKVNTKLYTSWVMGELVFKNMSFQNILKKMERHYNVTIINENLDMMNEKFNASFISDEPIEKVLESFKITYGINYKVEEKTITIY